MTRFHGSMVMFKVIVDHNGNYNNENNSNDKNNKKTEIGTINFIMINNNEIITNHNVNITKKPVTFLS